jgi:hypothetical protein
VLAGSERGGERAGARKPVSESAQPAASSGEPSSHGRRGRPARAERSERSRASAEAGGAASSGAGGGADRTSCETRGIGGGRGGTAPFSQSGGPSSSSVLGPARQHEQHTSTMSAVSVSKKAPTRSSAPTTVRTIMLTPTSCQVFDMPPAGEGTVAVAVEVAYGTSGGAGLVDEVA